MRFQFEELIVLASHQTTTSRSTEKPPLPRNETNLSGLKNQGATW
jgi:hypothetical protein